MTVDIDYTDVVGISPEEFWQRARCSVEMRADPNVFTKSDEEDIAKIERLLDMREGTLSCEEYYLENIRCECGRLLTVYDFVFTGLVDAGHSKSLILHTFIGNKYVLNNPRPVRCSDCGRVNTGTLDPRGGMY